MQEEGIHIRSALVDTSVQGLVADVRAAVAKIHKEQSIITIGGKQIPRWMNYIEGDVALVDEPEGNIYSSAYVETLA